MENGKLKMGENINKLTKDCLITVIASLRKMQTNETDFDKKAILNSNIDCLKQVFVNMEVYTEKDKKVTETVDLEA